MNAANAFIQSQLGARRLPKKPIAAKNSHPQDFRVLWFQERAEEAKWIATQIQSLLGTEYVESNGEQRGLTPGDFAILMRSTRTPESNGGAPRHAAFTEALKANNILFSLEAGGGPFERPQVSALRNSFELLRNGNPDRTTVKTFFDDEVCQAYPHADFNNLTEVFSQWGRDIHRPIGTSRQRLYPQKLVYDLLEAFRIVDTNWGQSQDAIMRDIGLFSRMILDIESVYMSVDSAQRFSEILNFLQNSAETGYDVSTDDFLLKPDSVTVSTVHKMKGLEFPCVFIVDVENQRFPKNRSSYSGQLPNVIINSAIARGAYQSTPEEEVRLFYTAITRAERYLYVSGSANTPGAKRVKKPSVFSLSLESSSISRDFNAIIPNLKRCHPKRRIADEDLPTSFSELRYYLRCPKEYQFRQCYGFSPSVPPLFGYGRAVHTAIERLHQQFPNKVPTKVDIEKLIEDSFHLKHVPPSNTSVPGAYENAKNRAIEITQAYVNKFKDDFTRSRQVEARFEIPDDTSERATTALRMA